MYIVISPSKTQDFTKDFSKELSGGKISATHFSSSVFTGETKKLSKITRKLSPKDLEKLMSISPKLADLNYHRFQKWNSIFSLRKKGKEGFNFSPAIFAFSGDVYRGFNLEAWNKKDFEFAQKSLKILSGFYGVLSPLNFLKPYRLEMGTKMSFNIGKKEYKNLYDFWGEKVTDYFIENFRKENKEGKVLVNLASVEYSKVLDRKRMKNEGVDIIDVDFKIQKGGELKTVAIFAKRARGEMANWIIEKKIIKTKYLTDFNYDGWKFSKKSSGDQRLCFIKRKD